MKQNLKIAILMTLVTTVLLGIIYPLVVTGLAQALFHDKANGQLISRHGDLMGSRIIGQGFAGPGYLHSRPSAAGNGYDAANSAGTNLGPTNQKLIDRVSADVARLQAENPGQPVPVDLVTTSASGLDPDITPAAAEFQVPRLAHERGLDEQQVRQIIQRHTAGRQLGFLGEPRVNVLAVNLALDDLSPLPKKVGSQLSGASQRPPDIVILSGGGRLWPPEPNDLRFVLPFSNTATSCLHGEHTFAASTLPSRPRGTTQFSPGRSPGSRDPTNLSPRRAPQINYPFTMLTHQFPTARLIGPNHEETALSEAIIEARAVEKYYPQPDGNRIEVIAPTDLSVYPGKIVGLLGPSGSGKSTLLRMLTGLSKPSSGHVVWHGKTIDGQIPNVAIVFQSFALFPWLTVLDNVEAPLIARGVGAIERHKRALKMIDTVGLDGFETAYPKELSGGMKQRVGFARALVVEPEVLFMDEPFSALDVLTAENLRSELLELWLSKKMPTQSIFIVTHNIEEAVLLADRVIVLGRNPARIRTDFEIDIPQYRDRKSPRFLAYVDYIYKALTRPQEDAAIPGKAAQASGNGQARERTKFQMLPHARPGGIAGFMELLADRGGRDDLYKLADELAMDVDDLLPIVEASAMLRFAVLREGDVEITPEGRTFGEADIQTQKTLFRDAALKNVAILRLIENTLHAKRDHAIGEDFFRDILDEHFSADEVERQFDTALNWGRYAEIFDYDSESGRLFHREDADVPAASEG